MKIFSLKLLLFFILFFIGSSSTAQASTLESDVLKSVFQVRIYDTYLSRYVSSGTGFSIGGFGTILTNYHVARLAIINPERYRAHACLTTVLGSAPDCSYSLSIVGTFLGTTIDPPRYDPSFDLALLYVEKIYYNGAWKTLDELPMDAIGFSTVNLSEYTKNYRDLHVGAPVYAIGYPDYGGDKAVQVAGLVTGYVTDQRSGQSLIISNFKISFGNSGGPVFDSTGKLVGVANACFVDLRDRCINGLFIPLPTLNWWYAKETNSEIFSWEGKKFYTPKDAIPSGVMKSAMCLTRDNAYFDPNISNDTCSCRTGFSKDSEGQCVVRVAVCVQNATLNGQQCICNSGFLPENGQCITYTASCQKFYGQYSNWNGKFETDGRYVCDCAPGYQWNKTRTSCEQKIVPLCSGELVDREGKCITHDQDCITHFGSNVHGMKRDDGKNGSTCDCNQGYRWNSTVTACVSNINPDQIRAQETALTKANGATANKFRGRILLQSIKGEQQSRAWYVSPRDLKRYLILSDSDLLDVVQRMARFINSVQFNTLQKNSKKAIGYFLVVTNGGGEYFVNSKDGRIYHLSSYSFVALQDAVGISVTDEDLRKITVGKLEIKR